ncbi:MAG: sodium:proton antiporter [Lachnospiraceae bacterium]|jgi:multicomponent Na+:H+ antiporter subunit C|nr:sodium:proton antiporter [Lachnospiraceae bacterium]MDD4525496.1 sodium:proton antiporter [Lachnospiraceae bacterium]NLC73627.1 cation:proton antiporter [Clostridiales bacterium]
MILVNYIASFFLIALGFYCMAVKKNLIKICIGMGIADYGANLLIVSVGFNPGGTAPIFTMSELTQASFFVDPVPQALTLTSIVIGACTTAMTLSLVIRLKEKYGTLQADQVRRLRG